MRRGRGGEVVVEEEEASKVYDVPVRHMGFRDGMEGENVFWTMTRRMDMRVEEVEQLKPRIRWVGGGVKGIF